MRKRLTNLTSSTFRQVVKHRRAVDNPDIVRMDNFYSMWRSRTIPDPRGGPQPACETVLLHHEQFKIPENLSRFAVRHGMAGFVKKMGPEIKSFVEERRQRCPAVSYSTHCHQLCAHPRNLATNSHCAVRASKSASCAHLSLSCLHRSFDRKDMIFPWNEKL